MIRWTVREIPVTGSTNADLLALVDEGGAIDHLVLRTDHQTAGRGRLDRRWEAPAGSNLLVSMLFTDPPAAPQVLTQAVGLAAVRSVDRWLEGASIKWPNDVLLDGAKLAGVLAQRHAAGPVVVGVGMNIGWAPDGAAALVPALVGDPSPPTPVQVLDAVLEELGALADERGRFDAATVLAGVAQRMSTLDSPVRVELPGDRIVTGRAVALADDGALEVEDGEGRRHRFDVGDVVHLRPRL